MGSLLDSETILIPQRTDLKSCPPQLAQEIVDEIIDLFSACGEGLETMQPEELVPYLQSLYLQANIG